MKRLLFSFVFLLIFTSTCYATESLCGIEFGKTRDEVILQAVTSQLNFVKEEFKDNKKQINFKHKTDSVYVYVTFDTVTGTSIDITKLSNVNVSLFINRVREISSDQRGTGRYELLAVSESDLLFIKDGLEDNTTRFIGFDSRNDMLMESLRK